MSGEFPCKALSFMFQICHGLTHCVLVDSSTFICWMSPFAILGVSGLFFTVILFFDGKSC